MASNINNSLNYASTSYVFQDVSFESSTTTNMTMTTATPEGRGFVAGFVASISVILVSELGDKTFFIAALMAMRNGRIMVFSGALAALASMTILSALGGKLVTQIIPRDYTFYISAALFFIFGMKMVHEGYMMSPDEAKEEMEEAQQEIAQHQQPARQNQRQQNLRPDETDVTVNFVNNNDAELADNMGGDVESGSAVSSASRVSPIEGALSDTTAGTPTPPAPRQNAQETPPCERLTKALCNFFRRRVLLSAMGVSLSSAFFSGFHVDLCGGMGRPVATCNDCLGVSRRCRRRDSGRDSRSRPLHRKCRYRRSTTRLENFRSPRDSFGWTRFYRFRLRRHRDGPGLTDSAGEKAVPISGGEIEDRHPRLWMTGLVIILIKHLLSNAALLV